MANKNKNNVSLLSKFKSTTEHLLYILKLVYETSKFLLFGMVLISILDGVLPLLNAYIASKLINELVEVLGAKSWDALKDVLWLLCLQFAYLILSRTATQFKSTMTSLAGELVANHIHVKIAKKTQEIDLADFDRPEFYEKLENANREASSRPITILNATLSLFSSIISTISFIITLGALNPLIPLVLLLLSVPSAIINFTYRKITYKYIKDHTTERRRMNYCSHVLTDRSFAKEIKLLNLHETFIERYKRLFGEYFSGLKRIYVRESVLHVVVYFLSISFNCLFLLFVAYKVCFDGLLVGDYSLYSTALTSVLSGVAAIVSNSSKIYEGTLFIDNMIEFMQVKSEIIPAVTPAATPKKGTKHTIEFRDVSFAYPGTEKLVIKNLNLTLKGGKSYALVGLNGAGKTTLIKLMTRLYDPTSGVILLDGINIKNYDVKELYAMYGIVFQDFSKYAVTAKENVTFGDINRPFDEERFNYAVEQSGINKFLSTLPRGYDTPLIRFFDKDATDLSIGQWQKVSVARAFYKDAEILILDEPTASLDPMSEAEIFKQFDELRSGKTTLFVSHRLSSAVAADEIIVMQNGQMLESGTHKELMEKHGAYYTLFTLQAEKYLENS
ncbi:MAG: ABC transporter ATP-binding protein [Clostridia bacterium]|nr:ABC transporter ATP-binding protein [Clostridia bacterium]